jgi:ubiquinone/menaquinone biosynthesis C-methylase UbiE
MGWAERHILGPDNRRWACSRARGDVLEVAVGTGLNIPHYAPDVRLTGIDLSPEMLDIARRRARELERPVVLVEGDAHELPFADASFDSVVCTFGLCEIPDVPRALSEMNRVLRPRGRLLLVDHVRSNSRAVYLIQRMIDPLSVLLLGDHMTRRPSEEVRAQAFEINERERFRWGGIVERLAAAKR